MTEHRFKVKTFNSPTFCDHCHKLLWGLVRQGVCCKKCHTNVHPRCAEHAAPCQGSSNLSYSNFYPPPSHRTYPSVELNHIASDSNTMGGTTNVTESRPSAVTSSHHSSMSYDTDDEYNLLNSSQDNESNHNNNNNNNTSIHSRKGWKSMVDDIIVSTSKHSTQRDLQSREPNLNLLTTTPKNMSRFVSRLHGLHSIKLVIHDILSWRNKVFTLLILTVFTILCLYPLILVLAPQLLILYYMATGYYHHTKSKVRRQAEGKPPKPPKSVDVDPNPKIKPTEFRSNMQFIQNSMGMFCDAYDAYILFTRQYFNWDHPENATILLKVVIVSIIPSFVLFYYVPLNHIFLIGGWLMFIGKTPLANAMCETLAPIITNKLNEKWELAKGMAKKWPEIIQVNKIQPPYENISPEPDSNMITDATINVPEESAYMITIYENQRWWFSLGFINYLLSSERPVWSDYSGTVSLPPRNMYTPPPGYDFMDNDWDIDCQWSTVTPDNEGWVYTDHFWGNPRSTAGVGYLTRRRKWIRRIIRVPESKDVNLVNASSSIPSIPTMAVSTPSQPSSPFISETIPLVKNNLYKLDESTLASSLQVNVDYSVPNDSISMINMPTHAESNGIPFSSSSSSTTNPIDTSLTTNPKHMLAVAEGMSNAPLNPVGTVTNNEDEDKSDLVTREQDVSQQEAVDEARMKVNDDSLTPEESQVRG